jgi:hypothetical protein
LTFYIAQLLIQIIISTFWCIIVEETINKHEKPINQKTSKKYNIKNNLKKEYYENSDVGK